jgi:epoxyqueuosine reductase
MEGLEAAMRAETLRKWAEKRGYEVAWGPWRVVEEAIEDLAQRRRSGEVDDLLAREYLGFLERASHPPEGRPAWVVLVLVPAPLHAVTFTKDGKPLRVLIPPTYVRYRANGAEVFGDLEKDVFGGAGLLPLTAPLKSVAARLGLTCYGRNNVTYAGGFGSGLQIVGCATNEDVSDGAAEPRPPKMLDACASCHACEGLCPTGAIVGDRFLLRAERCLVFFNERREEIPGWVPQSAHRCLIGCLACQAACPANAGKLKVTDTGLVITEEETKKILDPATPESDPHLLAAAEKIATLGLTEGTFLLWRNLRLLAAARGWVTSLQGDGAGAK